MLQICLTPRNPKQTRPSATALGSASDLPPVPRGITCRPSLHTLAISGAWVPPILLPKSLLTLPSPALSSLAALPSLPCPPLQLLCSHWASTSVTSLGRALRGTPALFPRLQLLPLPRQMGRTGWLPFRAITDGSWCLSIPAPSFSEALVYPDPQRSQWGEAPAPCCSIRLGQDTLPCSLLPASFPLRP